MNKTELYVHIPFCVKKCNYCDFVSFACSEEAKEAYFESLYRQINIKAEFTGKKTVDSVFFGGGTPSIVDSKYLVKTLDLLREKYDILPEAEITMEMNPASASFAKIKDYRGAGINRVSIGLQSANDNELQILGRPHRFKDFLQTYDEVRKAGIDNINIDIMSATPGQTMESYRNTLKEVRRLSPEHISAYSLIIEENTPFYDVYGNGKTGPYPVPDEDTEREMYYVTKEVLEAAGYNRYEISNYAKPGYECEHNKGYWTGKDYVGFGIAAASLIDGKRYQMHRGLDEFIKGDFSEEEEILSIQDKMAEFMFLGLRMTVGVSAEEFKRRFDKSIEAIYGDKLNKLTNQGLMEYSNGRCFLTERGIDVSNVCMAEFLFD